MIPTLLIIGATGDLTSRYLLPALGNLTARGALPDDFRLIGAAVDDWSEDVFVRHVRGIAGPLADAATYRQLDVTDADAVRAVVSDAASSGPVGVYVALPTGLVAATLDALADVELPAGSRIAVEKPFGDDPDSARRLDELLLRAAGAAGEPGVYRVDHALAMSGARNLVALRLANRIMADTWHCGAVEQVDVLWDETMALEGRAAYYDRAGALRDVMQNHMIQLLCLAAMEPPASTAPDDVGAAKLDVLRHAQVARDADGALLTRRARYTAGVLVGEPTPRPVPDYTDEEGVDPGHETETLAEVVLDLATPRWRGTRFVLRTGKALAAGRVGVLVHYRRPDGHPEGVRDRLWIGVDDPGDVRLELAGATLGPPAEVRPLTLTAPVPAADQPAYGHVLTDFLSGGKAYSVIGAEPVEAWRLFQPVFDDWRSGRTPLETYPAGSQVPMTEPSP
jgi:glucose-6-phosphate 1-dehydrogenase